MKAKRKTRPERQLRLRLRIVLIYNCPFSNGKYWASQTSSDMLSRSSDAHDRQAQHCKAHAASQPSHDGQVWQGPFVGQAWGYPLVGDKCWRPKAARCRKHQRTCERRHLNVSNALFVYSAFANLMTEIHLRSGLGGSVQARMGWTPGHRRTRTRMLRPRIRRLWRQAELRGRGWRLRAKNSLPLRGCIGSISTSAQISFSRLAVRSRDLVIPSNGKSTLVAGQDGAAVERLPAGTGRRQTKRFPSVGECDCISNCTLMQRKSMLLNRSSREPGWCPFVFGPVSSWAQGWG